MNPATVKRNKGHAIKKGDSFQENFFFCYDKRSFIEEEEDEEISD